MAHYVKIASVLFTTRAERGQPDAREIVLRETANTLDALRGKGLDLVVLCEGIESFAQQVDDAESVDRPGPLLGLYTDFARTAGCHIAGSVKLAESDHVYNSLVFIGPDGDILGAYHKVNLTLGEIGDGVRSGNQPVVIDTAIGRIGGAICFDLNFEEIRHGYRRLRPDIIAFASMYHGGLMQQMWAYECRAYFVAALPFLGGGILDPFGRPMALTDCYTPVAQARVNLDRAMVHLDYQREKFREIERRYGDEVCIDTPPNIGSALITSLTDQRTALDIVREYELELLDDYLARSAEANRDNR
ncbi:MAG: carbon-nitrogen hydrolase family protein [Anaerolineales bacterium]|nr:carbon-nitrogen hydrolase family protein [Anaerolineales bacterium]